NAAVAWVETKDEEAFICTFLFRLGCEAGTNRTKRSSRLRTNGNLGRIQNVKAGKQPAEGCPLREPVEYGTPNRLRSSIAPGVQCRREHARRRRDHPPAFPLLYRARTPSLRHSLDRPLVVQDSRKLAE